MLCLKELEVKNKKLACKKNHLDFLIAVKDKQFWGLV